MTLKTNIFNFFSKPSHFKKLNIKNRNVECLNTIQYQKSFASIKKFLILFLIVKSLTLYKIN